MLDEHAASTAALSATAAIRAHRARADGPS